MPKRSQAWRGSPTMMNTQATTPSGATAQTNGTRNGRGPVGLLVRAAPARRRRRARTRTASRCWSGRRSRPRRRPATPRATTTPVMQRRDVAACACFGWMLRGPLRQQAVARHREEDARLAVLEHQQHRRHRDGRAERDDPADRCEPGEFAARAPAGRPTRQFCVRHHAGEHGADDDVDDRADGQAAEDADRQVALRVLAFPRPPSKSRRSRCRRRTRSPRPGGCR